MMKTMFTPTIRKTALAVTMAVAGAFTLANCGKSNKPVEEAPKTPVELAEKSVKKAQEQYSKDSAEFVRMAPDSTANKEEYERLQNAVMAYYGVNNRDDLILDEMLNEVKKVHPNYKPDPNLEALEDSLRAAELRVDKSTGVNASVSKTILEEAKRTLAIVKFLENIKPTFSETNFKDAEHLESEIMKLMSDTRGLKLKKLEQQHKKYLDEARKNNSEIKELLKEINEIAFKDLCEKFGIDPSAPDAREQICKATLELWCEDKKNDSIFHQQVLESLQNIDNKLIESN